MQDFHTAIAGAMTDEEYVHELYNAMLEDAQQGLVSGMERAAQRCVKKAELKVRCHSHAELLKGLPAWVTKKAADVAFRVL